MKILEKIQSKIMDDNTKSKKYFFTKANKHYVIHIYNPESENIKLDSKNKQFYKELTDMLFNQEKDGCFNHEHHHKSYIYDLNLQELVNKFVSGSKYCLIMVNQEFNPLSFLSLGSDAIWSVCTNLKFRQKGYMTILMKHTLVLLKYNKIQTDVKYDYLFIYIKLINPAKDKLFKYYQGFGFEKYSEDSDFITMKLNKVSIPL